MKLGIIRGYSPEAFDFVKSKGLEFTEICCNFDPETENFNASADAIKAEIVRTGVSVQSVGRWNAAPNVGGKVNPEVAAKLKKSIDVAADIGAAAFICGVNYDDSVSLYRNLSCAVEYLGEMSEYAKTKEIKLGVYNCDWNNFLHRGEYWKIVLGELPEVGIKYDCSHSYNRGQDYLKELNEWMDRVVHMHIKGSINIGGKHIDDPPAGLDALNWPEIFGIIYAHKYNGGLSIEPHSGIWNGELGEKGIDYTIDFVNKFLFR